MVGTPGVEPERLLYKNSMLTATSCAPISLKNDNKVANIIFRYTLYILACL